MGKMLEVLDEALGEGPPSYNYFSSKEFRRQRGLVRLASLSPVTLRDSERDAALCTEGRSSLRSE